MLGPDSPLRVSNIESPSRRSPSLKRERTNYRTDYGYRTIRTYETPVKHSPKQEHPSQITNYESPVQRHQSPDRSPNRSKSPKLRSELTDYRTVSNYRTVRVYETPKASGSRNIESSTNADQDVRREAERGNFREFNQQRQPVTKRSPHLKAEPTTYREATSYRSVRVFDHTLHLEENQEEEVQSKHSNEPESEIKKPQQREGAKRDSGAVSKKLEFEEQNAKPVKGEERSREITSSKSSRNNAQGLFKTHEEQFLVKTLNRVLVYDKNLENHKNVLASCLDFTMQGAFKVLIGEEEGTKEQFEENLKNLGIFFTQTELDSVFQRFDADGDGKVSYHEFENVIYPVSRPYARMIRLRIDEQPLSKETLDLLIDFVNLIGSIEGAIEDLRTKVSKRVSLEDAFKALDARARGNVEIYEFKKLLESHGFCPESNDLAALKHRVDLNEDGLVTSEEFKISMSPVKGGK